jgi:hypothetical protein
MLTVAPAGGMRGSYPRRSKSAKTVLIAATAWRQQSFFGTSLWEPSMLFYDHPDNGLPNETRPPMPQVASPTLISRCRRPRKAAPMNRDFSSYMR